MVMEVKLHYFNGHGSTMAVAIKNQAQLKKLRIAKFIKKWKKKNLLPRKQCNFTFVTVVALWLYQQMIWQNNSNINRPKNHGEIENCNLKSHLWYFAVSKYPTTNMQPLRIAKMQGSAIKWRGQIKCFSSLIFLETVVQLSGVNYVPIFHE